MTSYDPLENLLVSAWKELAQYLPEEASYVALWLELERTAQEKDEKGNPTPRAHRAGARMRNAFLVEETNAKSKGKVIKDQAKVEKEIATVASRFLVLLVTARANAAKIAHIESVEKHHLADGENREQHDPESKFALASPFIDKLAQAGTSPSAIGRMPAPMVSFIALLIKDHAADPSFKNPHNVWNRIVRSGILEAYLGNLDDEHLKVVAQAACERDEQTNEWARRAREELNLPAGMDDRFLEAVARIRDAARSLTEGEARAYEDAYKLQDDRDVDSLAALLQMETQVDRIRLRALLDVVHRSIAPLKRDWKMEMQLGILKREIDTIAPQAKWHSDWKAELRERLEITFERLGPMGSIEAFNALLRSGLAVSDADWEFTKRLERNVVDGHFIAFENEVRAACKAGYEFKIYDNRVIHSHEPGYETIEAERWNGHYWLQEFGAWPGEDADERKGRHTGSGDQVADITEHLGGDTAFDRAASDRYNLPAGPEPAPGDPGAKSIDVDTHESGSSDSDSEEILIDLDDEEEGEEVDFYAIAAEESDPLDVDPPARSDAMGKFSTLTYNKDGDRGAHSQTDDVAENRPVTAASPTPHGLAQNTQSGLFPGDLPATPEDVCSPAGTLPMVPNQPVKPRRIEPAAIDKLKDEDFR